MKKLSVTQRRVVRGLMKGAVLKEIAWDMGINYRTMKCHIHRARVRMNCRTTEQMMFLLGKELA